MTIPTPCFVRYLGFNVEKFNHLDSKYPLLSLLEIYLGLRKSNLCFEYLHFGCIVCRKSAADKVLQHFAGRYDTLDDLCPVTCLPMYTLIILHTVLKHQFVNINKQHVTNLVTLNLSCFIDRHL